MPTTPVTRGAVLETNNCVPACTAGVATVGTVVAGVNAASPIPSEGAMGDCTSTLVGEGALMGKEDGPVFVNCRLCTEPLASDRKSKRSGRAAILTRMEESES